VGGCSIRARTPEITADRGQLLAVEQLLLGAAQVLRRPGESLIENQRSMALEIWRDGDKQVHVGRRNSRGGAAGNNQAPDTRSLDHRTTM